MDIIIKAIDIRTGETEIIDDLYWFEENGVHDFSGEGLHGDYKFEISIELKNNNIRG